MTLKLTAAWGEGTEVTLQLLETTDPVTNKQAETDAARLAHLLGHHLPAVTVYQLFNKLWEHINPQDRRINKRSVLNYSLFHLASKLDPEEEEIRVNHS